MFLLQGLWACRGLHSPLARRSSRIFATGFLVRKFLYVWVSCFAVCTRLMIITVSIRTGQSMGTMSYVRSMSFSHIFRIFFTIISGHFLKIDLLINFIHIEANQFQLQHDLLPADLLRPSDLHTGLLHTDGQGQSSVLPGLTLTKVVMLRSSGGMSSSERRMPALRRAGKPSRR